MARRSRTTRTKFPQLPAPRADDILIKYVQALGGRERLSALTSIVAQGFYQSFGETEKSPLDLFAKAPNQRGVIIHTPNGDNTTTYDGRSGWTAAPQTERPVTLLPLSGDWLSAAKLDAELAFPQQITQAFTQWRVGLPTMIQTRPAQVVQGGNAGAPPVKFYFDRESGLLLRIIRYNNTVIGLSPTQIDYSDYREVSGVRMPFRWTITWLDGRSTVELTAVQPNVGVDVAKFGKPTTANK